MPGKSENIFQQLEPFVGVFIWFVVGILAAIVLTAGGYRAYELSNSYKALQEKVANTSSQLQNTQSALQNMQLTLDAMRSSTTKTLSDQQLQIDQKGGQIEQLQADVQKSAVQTMAAVNLDSKTITAFAPSVVKIVCFENADSQDLQLGSGVLYHSANGSPAEYFVETNLHVVQTDDGSKSQCEFAIYPNYRDTATHYVYETTGYVAYKKGVDVAYVIPQLSKSTSAGTMAQLALYAKDITANTYCDDPNIGDHLSILGYPGVGGASLTATDGIISGFESDGGVRYIKTSAKVEHGDSGGIALEDSGCVLGIPTFVETGTVESLGRILDLKSLFPDPVILGKNLR